MMSDILLDHIVRAISRDPKVSIGERMTGEQSTVRMQHVVIDGETYLIQAKRVPKRGEHVE